MMKKLILFIPFFFCGCSMGINQSAIIINDKPYLVERPTYTAFGLAQWSGDIRYTELSQLDKQNKNQALMKCNEKLGANSTSYKMYQCITDELRATKQTEISSKEMK